MEKQTVVSSGRMAVYSYQVMVNCCLTQTTFSYFIFCIRTYLNKVSSAAKNMQAIPLK